MRLDLDGSNDFPLGMRLDLDGAKDFPLGMRLDLDGSKAFPLGMMLDLASFLIRLKPFGEKNLKSRVKTRPY